LRNKLKYYFLDEEKYDDKDRKKYIENCEKVIDNLRNLGLSFEGVNLIDQVKYRLLGYDINLSRAIQVLSLEKEWFKKKLFLLLFYFRVLHYYKIVHSKKKRDDYEVNLIDCDSVEGVRKGKVSTAFVCSDPSYFKTLMSLFEEMEKRKERFIVIVPKKAKSWGYLDKINCEIVFMEDFLDSDVKNTLKENQKIISEYYYKNQNKIERALDVCGHGLFSSSKHAMKVVFERYLPQTASFIQIADKIYSKYGVKVVVSAKLRRYVDNCFFAAAEKRSMKRVLVLPFLMTSDFESYYDNGNYYSPTDIVVWNEEQKEQVEDYFVDVVRKPKVYPHGNPQLDQFLSLNKNNNIREKLGLNKDEKFIVITSQPESCWPVKNVEDIVSVAKDLGVKVFIKIHPRQKKETYEGICEVLDDKDINLYELLNEAHIVLTGHSTTALEAFMMGTHSIVYNKYEVKSPLNERLLESYIKTGILSVDDKEELKDVMNKCLSEGKNKSRIDKDNNVVQKIVDLIVKSK